MRRARCSRGGGKKRWLDWAGCNEGCCGFNMSKSGKLQFFGHMYFLCCNGCEVSACTTRCCETSIFARRHALHQELYIPLFRCERYDQPQLGDKNYDDYSYERWTWQELGELPSTNPRAALAAQPIT
jgi:hypothetical protein